MPIARRAELPVPMPRITRPGAIRLIVARALAVTGAVRVPAIATPVPTFTRHVALATNAMQT